MDVATKRPLASRLSALTARPHTHRRALAAGVAIYVVSGLATLAAAQLWAGAPPQKVQPLLVLAVGLLLPAGLWWLLQRRHTLSRLFEVSSGLVMVAAVVLALLGVRPSLSYGDGAVFAQMLATASVFPRWLVGSALAVWLYKGFWTFPSFFVHLPVPLRNAAAFLHILCPIVMGIGSIAILRRWPDRLAAMIPVCIPLWWLFSSGYTEYYPLMIGAWLAALLWLFERPLEERSPHAVGALAGILPAIYVGFVGLGILLVFAYAGARPRRTLAALGSAAATLAVTIAVCWPGGVVSFLGSLAANMNLGSQNLLYGRYRGRAANPWSIFFSTHYAFIHTHLLDLAYMSFWGNSWLVAPLLVGAAILAWRRTVPSRLRLASDARLWLGAALVLWQVYYFIYMIPRLGPTGDVDLFCPTFVVLAFAAGRLLDASWPDGDRRRAVAYPLLCALLGCALVTSTYLAWLGLPTRL